MTNLIKMEWYKLRTTRMFYILLGVVFAVNLLLGAIVPVLMKLITPEYKINPTDISDAIASPFSAGLLMLCVFISAVSFMYIDFSDGYIKNIAGQVNRRGSIVISKFIVVGIHNLIFFVVGSFSSVIGSAIGGTLAFDDSIVAGILTLLLKWLLAMALTSILLFIAVGLRSKTFAIILAVIFSVSALSLAYMGINAAVTTIFKVQEFQLGNYMPDALMGSVNVITNTLVPNGIIVSVIFITIFLILTYRFFESRDVK